jgi:hypothetical protein
VQGLWGRLGPSQSRAWASRAKLIVAAALTVAVAAGVGTWILSPPPAPGGAQSHDLAQNVAAAQLIASGRGDALYDQAAEHSQRLALVGPEPGLAYPPGMPFISPAWRALLYVPFAWLPYPALAAAHRLLLVCALFAAMYLMRRWLPVPWVLAAALTIASPASLGGLQAGQTIHFTVLAWVVAARLVDARRPNAAAAVLGLALFKPDLVLVGLVVLALRGGWRGAVAVGGGVYLLSALATGEPLWGVSWWQAANTAALAYTGPLNYLRVGALAAAGLGVGWLAAPARWRGPLLLILAVGSLAATPYHWGYDDLLIAPGLWVGLWWATHAIGHLWPARWRLTGALLGIAR